MAKDGYWDEQFNQALPVFLSNWFASTFADEMEQSCEREGVASLLKFTAGRYKTDLVGLWVNHHMKAVERILDLLEEGAANGDLIHRALRSRIAFSHILSRGQTGPPHKPLMESYPDQLHEAMCYALGKKIQETKWWRSNLSEIKRGSRYILAVKRVMEC